MHFVDGTELLNERLQFDSMPRDWVGEFYSKIHAPAVLKNCAV
jgi:hypothetical protein